MSERFIKFIPSKEAMFLVTHKNAAYQNAFRLLTIIAERARRYDGHPDGLKVGQCHLGKWSDYGMSEQNYKTAKKILERMQLIKIIETNRTRKKVTTGITTEGTLVELCSTTIYDINVQDGNDSSNDCLTTDQRLPNDKLRKIRRNKKEKNHHPQTPSKRRGRMTDDFSSQNEPEEKLIDVCSGVSMSPKDMEACIAIKGSLEKVREAIAFIQASKKRKHPIVDWPNALARWKIENKTQVRIEDHVAHAEKLCQEFADFSSSRQWRCSMYTDRKKDQKGLLFESQNPYQEAFFIAIVDGDFQKKCEQFIETKNMRRQA